jgi:hypothetical protein
MEAKELNTYKIETLQNSRFIFFTKAINTKKALRNLELNSSDFKKIVNKDKDFSITISKL